VALLRLPYVRTYRDRHGRLRRYFRRHGQPDTPLPGEIGSEEFMLAYQAALGGLPKRQSPHAAGTLSRLIEEYYQAVEFANLKPSSRSRYRLILDSIAKRDGHRLVRDMPRDKVRKILQEIGANRPGMANLTQKILRVLMQYAIDVGWRNDNPVAGIKPYRLGTRHTWSDEELAAFEARWPLGTRERLAYALLLYTGQRVGDVVRMRRQDISKGRISLVQQKTGAALSIPIHPRLQEVLAAGPARGFHLIGDQHGRAIRPSALTKMMTRAAAAAGLGHECLPHGLRKACLRRLAEHGGSAKEIAAISGHKSLGEVERYTAAADQRKLSRAAMAKLTEPKGEDEE
jgi:enterobacteria phage integrase